MLDEGETDETGKEDREERKRFTLHDLHESGGGARDQYLVCISFSHFTLFNVVLNLPSSPLSLTLDHVEIGRASCRERV